VPADAVITAVSGYAGWNDNAPGGQHYEHAICFNTSSTCTVFPGTAAELLVNRGQACGRGAACGDDEDRLRRAHYPRRL
jgi:hypothetical protein